MYCGGECIDEDVENGVVEAMADGVQVCDNVHQHCRAMRRKSAQASHFSIFYSPPCESELRTKNRMRSAVFQVAFQTYVRKKNNNEVA